MKLRIAAKIDRADSDYFERQIKPKLRHPLIEFIGEIGNSEKGEFLGNASALLFPIDWPEPFGLVMIESMACGTPVIAYPCGSVPEIIRDGLNGFVVRNVDEAVQAVKKLPTIDRKKCRQYFELNFSDERMAEEYLRIYQKLIHSKSAAMEVEKEVLNWMEAESQTPSTT
jgi:glycosyltransferase involved in cell wall biosynthesis